MSASQIQLKDFQRNWADDPLWRAFRRRWYWFLLAPLGCVGLGMVFLRYKTPEYNITASLLIRDDSRGSDFRETALLEELGLPDATSSVENEIEILKSRTLLGQVVDDLHLDLEYYATGNLKTAELYEKTPFKVSITKRRPALPSIYQIEKVAGDSFLLGNAGNMYAGHFGQLLQLPHGLAMIEKTRFQPSPNDGYSFRISDREAITDQYARSLTVQATNKTASLVTLSVQDALPRKGEAFLRQLINRYQQASIAEKNKAADNTIAFINIHLKSVSEELAQVEDSIEDFRRRHQITDLKEDGRLALQQLNASHTQAHGLTIRLKSLRALQKHLNENPATAIPLALYPQESSFAELASKYNEMQVLLAKTRMSRSEQHPDVRTLNAQLLVIRSSLFDAVHYQMQELTLSIAAFHSQARGFGAQIARLPGYERQYLSHARAQGIQQDLYLFLLKKRMETAISRSANMANARIVDPPRASRMPAFPNRQLTLLLAFMTGLLLPASVIYTEQLLDDKITSKEDIRRHSDVPVIGEISQQRHSAKLIRTDTRSIVREQFRTLRTNIDFISGTRQNMVILLTSAMAGEGKSFVAAHLAQALAMAGKKVLLADFDLRKPSLDKLLDLRSEGLTDALKTGVTPCIQPCEIPWHGITPTFDFLAAGTSCMSAGELLLSAELEALIHKLKPRYDYLLLDSPPAGLVADARLLGRHADMTLYIVRQHCTFRHQVAAIGDLQAGAQLPEMYIVLNGSRDLRRYQYGYY